MKKILAPLAALIALVLPAIAAAQGSAPDPVALLKERNQYVRRYLKENPLPLKDEQRRHIENQLNDLFDYRYIALQSIDGYRDKATPKQLEEYVDTFAAVTRRNTSSTESLEAFLEGEIFYEGKEKLESGHTLVRTVIEKNAEEIYVDYVFDFQNGKWRIIDYRLDDVGLIENYQSAFGQIIIEHGFQELIDRLKEKLEKQEES